MKQRIKLPMLLVSLLFVFSTGMLTGCDSRGEEKSGSDAANIKTRAGGEVYFEEYFDDGVPGAMISYDAGDTNFTWESADYGDAPCAKMSAYSSGYYADEDWLITPSMDFTDAEVPLLTFIEAIRYAGAVETDCGIYASTDYSGSGDPGSATWTLLTAETRDDNGSNWDFTNVSVDLSSLNGAESVYIAFKYLSTTSAAATWELDTILIEEDPSERITVSEESVSLITSEGTASDSQSITVAGENLSTGITAVVADSTNFEVSADGSAWASSAVIPQSGGSASGDIYVRIKAASQTGYLDTMITCTSGSGSASLVVKGVVFPASGLTSFNEDFTYSVPGQFLIYDKINTDYTWESANFGSAAPCAKISAFAGEAFSDEDWLITPKLNLSSMSTPELTFVEAVRYAYSVETDCGIYVSTDYAGSGDPNLATWTKLTGYSRDDNGSNWDFTDVAVDLASLAGESAVYIAFKYTSTTSYAATWEIDTVEIKDNTAERIALYNDSVSLATTEGIASDSASVAVTGYNLTADITVSVDDSTNFEISVDAGSSWGSSASITQSSGTAVGTVAVRIKDSATAGSPTATVSLSAGSASASIAVDAIVNPGSGLSSFSENFSSGVPGQFASYDAINSSFSWVSANYGDAPCAKMSAYSGAAYADEDWLITPKLNFSSLSAPQLTFIEAINYASDISAECQILYSTDYSGSGDPGSATWTGLSADTRASGSDWTFVDATVDLSSLAGQSSVYIAFKYTSTASGACTWEIDTVNIGE